MTVLIVMASGCIFEDPVVSEAVAAKDPGLCLSLEDRRDINDCVRKVALAAEDADMCDEYINKGVNYENQLGQCLSDVGGRTGDLTLCDRGASEYQKWDCYKEVGVLKQQPQVCAGIDMPSYKSDCYARIGMETGNIDLCQKAAEADKGTMSDACFRDKAVGDNNYELCQHIDSKITRDACYMDIAVETGNADACRGMTKDYSNICLAKVTGDPSVCDGGGEYREGCLAEVAAQTGRSDLCDGLGEYQKRRCLMGAAEASGNERLCDDVEESYRDSCLSGAARASGKTDVCMKIKSPTTQKSCIEDVAVTSGNLSKCDAITNDKDREHCMTRVVRSSTTTTIPYENKSFIGKAQDDIGGYAESAIMDLIGF